MAVRPDHYYQTLMAELAKADAASADLAAGTFSPVEPVSPLSPTWTRIGAVRTPSGKTVRAIGKQFKAFTPVVCASKGALPRRALTGDLIARLLACRLGPPYRDMVPPAALMSLDGRRTFVQQWVDGVEITRDGVWRCHLQSALDAAFFDYLTGQQDRAGNFLMSNSGKLTLIDNGFILHPRHLWPTHGRTFVSERAAGHAGLSRGESDLINSLMAQPDRFLNGLPGWGRRRVLSRANRLRLTGGIPIRRVMR